MGNPFSGQPDFSGQLNATLYQIFENGTVIQTPCYLDITKTPMQATDLAPVDEHLIAGPETDRYIILNNDPAKNPYRAYQVIGVTNSVEVD